MKSFDVSEYEIFVQKNIIPENGYVPDAKTAIKIAKAALYAKYGENIDDIKSFKVRYDANDQVWLLEGVPKKNLFSFLYTIMGGEPYVIINKNDGRVIAMWHTK